MIEIANIFQPLVDVFNQVISFFHDELGLSWGASIIALTVGVRFLLLPLAFKQYSSMRGMQEAAPQIKALQAKYKDDKQRLQQETMKFYKENKINPFASCMPLVAQLPVFLALFYALRTDLREDICNQTAKSCGDVANAAGGTGGFGEKFLFIPDITDKATGYVLAILIVTYIASQLASSLLMMTAATDKNQRIIFLALPFFMTAFVFNFPAGLLVYWITTNLWTVGQQQLIKRILGAPNIPEPDPNAPKVGMFDQIKAQITGDDPAPAKAKAAVAGDAGRTKTPPPPPRRKRKRSGKRR
ncbi:MAG TPA: YidC/Oxa1 family membrane protein insertase [Baekduia sp.]|nr:YidC/Oxa1 family membrane protein insertase [Baekduia sp.]